MEISNIGAFIQLLSKELAVEIDEIMPGMPFRELKNWSSLNALLILSRIQEETGKVIAPTKLATAKTVQDFFKLTKEA